VIISLFSATSVPSTDRLVLFFGQAMVVGAALLIALALVYFKKVGWLWKNWVTSLDHKKIGIMYLVVAGVMLLRGLADTVLLRFQQATSSGTSHGIVSSNHYQQIFTAHGTMMIFFVAMGLVFGIINLILPLQIGSRDVAFPLLNNLSFWMYAAGAILINLSLVFGGEFAATGWLAYPPLSELQFSPGVGVDYWIWSIQIAGIGTLLSGINFITTILTKRAPGMSMMKMPVFVWSVLAAMTLVAAAFPILAVTLVLLTLDRTIGTHFFTTAGGGNAMMYVNLIWAWGHPEVYILILPAFGIYSEIVATFSRKRLFGYASMVYAIIAIAGLSFLVWLHHFFTMGAGANVNAFFGIMTMVIAIPTGLKVFNWLFTMYRGRINFASPMIWFIGFVITFSIGGAAGVMLGVPPIDFQLHNTLFLVAHFHTMIIGGALFGYFAGIAYWFPKVFGFKLDEKLGKIAAYLWIAGLICAFTPLYILGLMGATRRLDHYDASLGWQGLFIVAGVGVVIILAGVAVQSMMFYLAIKNRKKNLDTTGDPWNGRTLEWSTTSPAPVYNFAIIPTVSDRDEFFRRKQLGGILPRRKYAAIVMPNNSSFGIFMAGWALMFAFSVIWHYPPTMIVALLGVIGTFIVRTFDDTTTHIIPAAEIEAIENKRAGALV